MKEGEMGDACGMHGMKKVHTGRPSHRLEDNTEMDLTKNRMGNCELDSFDSG
jgi:hypothetical protein